MGGAVSVTNIVDATIEEACSKVGGEYSDIISSFSSSYFLGPSRRSKYEYADNEGSSNYGDDDDITSLIALSEGKREREVISGSGIHAKYSNQFIQLPLHRDISRERDIADFKEAMVPSPSHMQSSSNSMSSRSSISNISGLAKKFHSKLSIRSSYLDLSSNDSSSISIISNSNNSTDSTANPFSKSIYNCTSFYDSRNRRSNNYRHIDGSSNNLLNLNNSVIKEIHSDDSFRSNENSIIFQQQQQQHLQLQQHTSHKITDDSDWIQVDDDDEEGTDSHSQGGLLLHGHVHVHGHGQESKGSSSDFRSDLDNHHAKVVAAPINGKPFKLTIQLNSSLHVESDPKLGGNNTNLNRINDDNDNDAAYVRSPLARYTQNSDPKQSRNQSYMFTQSGTIFVDGLKGGIKKYGLAASQDSSNASNSSAGSGAGTGGSGSISQPGATYNGSGVVIGGPGLLTMKERLVVLAKLGQGASSVVFKAFDIVTQRLVAIKMISIFDKGKRRQMVRELVSLFDVIHSSIKLYGNNSSKYNNSSNNMNMNNYDNDNDNDNNNNNNNNNNDGSNSLNGGSISGSGSDNNISSNSSESSKYVVDFYDVFSNIDDGRVVLMMEYIDGGSLQDVIDDLRTRQLRTMSLGGARPGLGSGSGSGDMRAEEKDDSNSISSCLLTEAIISKVARQCLKCIAFLHSLHCLHRDVKPSNFLISRNGAIKIADMGILKRLDGHLTSAPTTTTTTNNNGSNNTIEKSVETRGDVSESKTVLDGKGSVAPSLFKTKTFVGTTVYMSPERLEGREYSFDSDIWSLGLSLLSIALGKSPFEGVSSYWSVLQAIREGVLPTSTTKQQQQQQHRDENGGFSSRNERSEYYSNFFLYSDVCRDFIRLCLQESPENRPSPSSLLLHEFIQRYNNTNNNEEEEAESTLLASGSNSNTGAGTDAVIMSSPSSPYPSGPMRSNSIDNNDVDLQVQSIEEHRLILMSTRKHLALLKAGARLEQAEFLSGDSVGGGLASIASTSTTGTSYPTPTPNAPTLGPTHNKPKLKLVIDQSPVTASTTADSSSSQIDDASSFGSATPAVLRSPPLFDKVILGDLLNSSIKSMMCRIFFGTDDLPEQPAEDNRQYHYSPFAAADNLNPHVPAPSPSLCSPNPDPSSNSRLRLISNQLYISDIRVLEKETITFISSLPEAE